MGSKQRPKPKELARKLLEIRESLGLSQNELIEKMGLKGEMFRSTISSYERGTREPSYIMLLKYARLVGVSTDVLIDDELDFNAD